MEFNKNQKIAIGVVGGLLGLSWYMGNQFEKADMMRAETFEARSRGGKPLLKRQEKLMVGSRDFEAQGRDVMGSFVKLDCDLCGGKDEVGYVDENLTLKVCEHCDVGGDNYNPKLLEAETFNADEAEYQELIDLSNEAKEQYMELVDESDIEEFCEEYDLDYDDYDDRKRAVSKYLDQIPFEPHIIEALDDDDQERYYQLKTIVYGAETFNAQMDGDIFTDSDYYSMYYGAKDKDGKSHLSDNALISNWTSGLQGRPSTHRKTGEKSIYPQETMCGMKSAKENPLHHFGGKTRWNPKKAAKALEKESNVCKKCLSHAEKQLWKFDAETMTPSEVKVEVTKDVTPKGSKIIVEECVDIQAKKADTTSNFYRVRFRDPSEMSNFRVPAWAARAANTMGSKYYDVAGSKVTMGQDKSGNWKIQSVMIPKRANVDVDLALKIANHIQDRLEKEGKWAPKKCQDNERVLVIR